MQKSAIEIFELDKSQLEAVFNQGHVGSFILNESLFSKTLELPYFRFVSESQISDLSSHAELPTFQGAILRISDFRLKDLDPVKLQQFDLIDLKITKPKLSFQVLEKLENLKSFQVFFELDEHAPISYYHKVLQSLDRFKNLRFPKRFYDLTHKTFKNWIDLETYSLPFYEKRQGHPAYSVVIPHYESKHFVCNVLYHLSQVQHSDRLEVILVDDGSKPETVNYILYFIKKHCSQLNLAFYGWPRGPKVFRAGASRNMGVHFSKANRLVFLDSDMLVPKNFCEVLDTCFAKADVTQFKRLHIPPELSHESSQYDQLLHEKSLFIEEKEYWGPLFESEDWMSFDHFWKFTCTYALAVKKSDFLSVGRFRRNFIQYGFEDTDLGYRLAQRGAKFRIEKTPLLHLSHKMEKGGWYFRYQKMQRIKPMAQTFFKLNQDTKIYDSLRSLMD